MFLSFNGSQLLATSEAGFQVYDASPTFRRLTNETGLGGVSCAAIEETSGSVIACLSNVGTHLLNRVVVIYDLSAKSVITEMHFEEPVIAIKVNILRLVVILEKRTHMFDWKTLTPLPQIATISPVNSKGLGALSSCYTYGESSYFAWPHTDGGQTRGDAVVMDVQTGKTSLITAHQTSPIVALEFSPGGTRLATSSLKGTIIRVFSIPTGELLYTFRRGAKDALIDSLVFSPSGAFLAVTSNSTTLHVFRCDREGGGNYLSTSMALDKPGGSAGSGRGDEDIRSFAKITVKENVRYAVGMSENDDQLFLIAKPPVIVGSAAAAPNSEVTMETFAISKSGGELKKIGEYRVR